MTFTLDAATVATLKRMARQSGKPQSLIVREAVAEYGQRSDRLAPAERRRMLATFREVMSTLSQRPDGEAAAEMDEVRKARHEDHREW